MVIDTKLGATLHRTLMDGELARRLCDFFESRGHAVLAMQDTGHAGVDYLISRGMPLNDATQRWMSVTAAAIHREDDLSHHSHQHTMRVSIVAPPELIEAAQRQLLEVFGTSIVSHRLVVPAYGVEVLEVFDQAVNKWEGILHVARRHGIEPREIIAIGDDINDMPMIKNAGLGVAMGNANPQLQAAADQVIGHNRDDGVAVFLEELIDHHMVERIDLNEQPSH